MQDDLNINENHTQHIHKHAHSLAILNKTVHIYIFNTVLDNYNDYSLLSFSKLLVLHF